jgi:CheY-like chemotaxis protein
VKILVVDDDAGSLQLMRILIEQHGGEPYLFDDPHEAIKAAADIQPDLVALDLLLRGNMSGLEAASWLRGSGCCAHIPILAMTAAPETITRQMALNAGCDAFLSKPFQVNEWQHMVEVLVA